MKKINSLDDFKLFEAIIYFDLEYTCWGDNNVKNNWLDVKRPPEIIQMGFAYYEKHKNKIGSAFSSYVKPKKNPILSSYCKRLLNIEQRLICKSHSLKKVVYSLSKWLNELSINYFLTSWGQEDYSLFSDDCFRQDIPNPLSNKPYLDLMRLSYDTIGLSDVKYMDREEVKKYLTIHENNHVHDALKDAIELKDILNGLKKKYNEQFVI